MHKMLDWGDSMIEVRVFATLRQGREKVTMLSPEGFSTAADILRHMDIPAKEVSILLINGFHSKPESSVKDGDILAFFPPVGGG
jgi:sulfur-carrier protein